MGGGVVGGDPERRIEGKGGDGWKDKRWIKVVFQIGKNGLYVLHVCVFNVSVFSVNSKLRDVCDFIC